MKCFSAVSKDVHHTGSWLDCLYWSRQQTTDNDNCVRVFVSRGGERYWRLIAEVTSEGVNLIEKGRIVTLRGMRKCQRNLG